MAEPLEIINEIEALTVHCRPPIMSVEQRARWQQDWVRDLAKLPLESIQAAFRQWRQGESTKFPTPGQILPVIERAAGMRSGHAVDSAPWRYDISDEDYRALTLNDKIRHHMASAAHCRERAGPMPHRGAPVLKADMPAPWHQWRDRAANHDAEVKRLRESIGRWDQRA